MADLTSGEGLAPAEVSVEAVPISPEPSAMSGDAKAWLDMGKTLGETDRQLAIRHFAGPLPDAAPTIVPVAGTESSVTSSTTVGPDAAAVGAESSTANDPVAEAVRRANERLNPKIEAEAEAKIVAVSSNSRTEFNDLQARKDTLTPEENARMKKMIEQQQERTFLLRRQEAGTPLTDVEEARLKELNGGWGEQDTTSGESKDKSLTAEERASEMKALREKIKSGDFKPEDEAKLASLEDDEIESIAAEYDPSNPDSLVETAQKLQDISESRRGYAENKTMKETMARVFKEWVAERSNPEANLSAAEKAALKKVQELVGEMHKDLLTIINANKQIKKVQKDVDVAIKDTKAQEAKVARFSDISGNNEAKQEEALKLEAMYVNLLNKKAQLLGAANAVRFANNDFRVKRAQVRRALGLTGFMSGLIESTTVRARNSIGNGAANIDSFLNGKPLAEKYINKRL